VGWLGWLQMCLQSIAHMLIVQKYSVSWMSDFLKLAK
jgi:hypothetical protein